MIVVPAKAGTQFFVSNEELDSGLRRNDETLFQPENGASQSESAPSAEPITVAASTSLG